MRKEGSDSGFIENVELMGSTDGLDGRKNDSKGERNQE